MKKFLTLSTLVFGAVFGTVQANADYCGRSDCGLDICDPCNNNNHCNDYCCDDPCDYRCDPCCNQWYLGVNYVNSGVFERDPNTTYGFADSKYHWGLELFAGYDFCNCFAFEAGFVYLGNTHLSHHGSSDQFYHKYHKRKSYGAPLRFVYTHNLSCKLDLVAFVGAFFYLDKYSERLAEFQSTGHKCSETHSGVDLTWGFGAEYAWCDDIAFRVTWSRYEFNHAWNHKDTFNLGVVWKF